MSNLNLHSFFHCRKKNQKSLALILKLTYLSSKAKQKETQLRYSRSLKQLFVFNALLRRIGARF